MRSVLFIITLIVGLSSCGDDFENCQTCIGAAGTNAEITSEYCQDGPDVVSTVDGVVTVIPNTTVEVVVATQLSLGNVDCN